MFAIAGRLRILGRNRIQPAVSRMNPKRIFFSVGEPSGDLHASNLIHDLKTHAPKTDFEFLGFGGPKMEQAGCHLLREMTSLAVMFLTGVFSRIFTFRKLLKQADEVFRTGNVDLVVLIDYSGFNWHVARCARKHSIPVVFYGIPQMWAWAPWRVRKMRRNVDLGICKLPFEQSWLQERGCKAEYVGHPFFDEMERQTFDHEFIASEKKRLGDRDLVLLLPGSRRQELKTNVPVFLETARKIARQRPGTCFALSCLNDEQATTVREILAHFASERDGSESVPEIPVYGGKTPELIDLAKCCLACSGSVSLELMYREKPTVIHYQIPRWLYVAQKLMLRVRYITLVNLLWSDSIERTGMQVFDPDAPNANEVPFPEYLTTGDRTEDMKNRLVRLLDDHGYYQQKKQILGQLKDDFGQPGASRRAAIILWDRFLTAGRSGQEKTPEAAA